MSQEKKKSLKFYKIVRSNETIRNGTNLMWFNVTPNSIKALPFLKNTELSINSLTEYKTFLFPIVFQRYAFVFAVFVKLEFLNKYIYI